MKPYTSKSDSALIRDLGGPTKVARLLGYPQGGVQRVSNWIRRGIPPGVKVAYPNLFLPWLTGSADGAPKKRKAQPHKGNSHD